MVAAIAVDYVERAEQSGRLVTAPIVTSDVPHLTKLVNGTMRVRIAHLGKLADAAIP